MSKLKKRANRYGRTDPNCRKVSLLKINTLGLGAGFLVDLDVLGPTLSVIIQYYLKKYTRD